MSPLISVVIPAYNHQLFVTETIKSILAQTYGPIELIVVDDGSQDDTVEEVIRLRERCTDHFHRFKFVQKENEGVAMTLNRGIDLSQGSYLYLIASDDIAAPHALERLLSRIQDSPSVAAVVGDSDMINQKGDRVRWKSITREVAVDPSDAKIHTVADLMTELSGDPNILTETLGTYSKFLEGCFIPNGVLYRKSAVLDVGKFRADCPMEDWYMHLQLSKKYEYRYIPEVLFSYRQHSANTWNGDAEATFAQPTRQVLLNERSYCEQAGIMEHWKRCFVQHGSHLLDQRECATKAYEESDFAGALKSFCEYVPLYRERCRPSDFIYATYSALRCGQGEAALEFISLARAAGIERDSSLKELFQKLQAMSLKVGDLN